VLSSGSRTWQVRQIARLGLNRFSVIQASRYYAASLHKIRLSYTLTYSSIIQVFLKYEGTKAFSDLLQIRTLPDLKEIGSHGFERYLS